MMRRTKSVHPSNPVGGSTMTHTIVMTGATRGIGRVAVSRILEGDPGAHLVLLARGAGGEQLAAQLRRDGRAVTAIDADLSSMRSVRRAADEVVAGLDAGELPPLRGLVANAGLQFTNAVTESPDGFEATFATNVLANHLLVRVLQNRFTRPSRIVITVSDTHFGDFQHNMGMVPGPQWQDPSTLARIGAFPKPGTVAAGRTAYSTSKLAAIHQVHEFARRLPAGVDIVGYNPGFVPGTGLARDAGAIAQFAMARVMPLLTITPAATTRKAAGRYLADLVVGRPPASSGAYVDRAKAVPSSAESYDADRERRLWEVAEKLTRTVDV
jgi:NAD(P)-dependent dehydrogenase (short-subunit alcohol dehydrogenase family)